MSCRLCIAFPQPDEPAVWHGCPAATRVLLYKALVAALPDKSRRPGVGDYAVASVGFPKDDMWFIDYLKAIFPAIETQREDLNLIRRPAGRPTVSPLRPTRPSSQSCPVSWS